MATSTHQPNADAQGHLEFENSNRWSTRQLVTMALMCALGTTGTTRASFALYNTEEEVQAFLKSMNRALDMLS